jgi:hypothetical protein
MEATALAIYILMWPMVAAVVLAVLWTATYRDIKRAREEGEDVV